MKVYCEMWDQTNELICDILIPSSPVFLKVRFSGWKKEMHTSLEEVK